MNSSTSKAAALLLALGLTSQADAWCLLGWGCPEETTAPTLNPTTNTPNSLSPTTSIPTFASTTESLTPTTTPIFKPTTGITIEAKRYSNMQGAHTKNTIDEGSGKNVSSIDIDDWMSYPEVMIPSTGWYTVEYRFASKSRGGSF
jgi:hypothetical protein